jgi:sugar/nucleoside kinase (ribokinase family)
MKITFDFNEQDTQETLDVFLQAPKMHQALLDLDRTFKQWDSADKEITSEFVRECFYGIVNENEIKLY